MLSDLDSNYNVHKFALISREIIKFVWGLLGCKMLKYSANLIFPSMKVTMLLK